MILELGAYKAPFKIVVLEAALRIRAGMHTGVVAPHLATALYGATVPGCTPIRLRRNPFRFHSFGAAALTAGCTLRVMCWSIAARSRANASSSEVSQSLMP